MKTTWGELEEGMIVVGGGVEFEIVDLRADTITVDSREKGLQTFPRKDPWEEVEIKAPSVLEVVEAWGSAEPISMTVDDVTSYFEWPDDPDFRSAAQSHLTRLHNVDPGDRDYAALRELHDLLHQQGADHTHVSRDILEED